MIRPSVVIICAGAALAAASFPALANPPTEQGAPKTQPKSPQAIDTFLKIDGVKGETQSRRVPPPPPAPKK